MLQKLDFYDSLRPIRLQLFDPNLVYSFSMNGELKGNERFYLINSIW